MKEEKIMKSPPLKVNKSLPVKGSEFLFFTLSASPSLNSPHHKEKKRTTDKP